MLKNKTVLITGALGLLGKQLVKDILELNANVILTDIDINLGVKLEKELKLIYGNEKVYFHHLDINSNESVSKCIKFTINTFGKIDSIINNAYPRNKNYGKKFESVEYLDFCENINLNLGGYFLVSQLFIDIFKNQGYGNIINIGSIYGVVPPKFEIYKNSDFTMPVEYSIIKSGLIALTKYMAKYFKGNQIRINLVSPGGIYNDHNDSFTKEYNKKCLNKGMLDPKDISGAVCFLLSDSSKYINGQNIIVDDGFVL